MSSRATMRRGFQVRVRRIATAGSPPERVLCRSDARRSSRSPRRCRRRRRDNRWGGFTESVRSSGASALSSSAVSWAKSTSVSLSSQLASVGIGRPVSSPTALSGASDRPADDTFDLMSSLTEWPLRCGGRRKAPGSPRDSATSTIPRNTSAKTLSNTAMSAVVRNKLTRAHQYSSSMDRGTSSAVSAASLIVWSGETATPSSRSRSLKWASSVAVSARMGAELVEARPSTGSGRMFDRRSGCPGELLIFDVLQYRAKRPVHRRGIHGAYAEQLERSNPIDGLGDAGTFLQVQPTQPFDYPCGLLGKCSRAAWHAPPHDLSRPRRRWVLDPMEKASALERVMQFTRPVRRQHYDRSVRGTHSTELRNGHRALAEQLQQEGLEVVVGAIDFVDKEDRRSRAGMT